MKQVIFILCLSIALSITMKAQVIIDCQEVDENTIEENLLLKFSFDFNDFNSAPSGIPGNGEALEYVEDRNGDSNNALELASERAIRFEHNEDLKPEFPFSFAFWVYPYELGLLKNYIYTSDLLKNERAGFSIQTFSDNNQIHFFYANGCYLEACRFGKKSLVGLEENEWTHVAIVVNGPDDMDIYFDGCPVESILIGFGPQNLYYTESDSYIGKADPSASADGLISYFNGRIDEFHFWDRVVNPGEIKFLYESFDVPAIDLENEYFLSKTLPSITLELAPGFENIVWQDTSMTQEYTITEAGEYTVVGEFNCQKVCHSFTVYVEPPTPPIVTEFTTILCPNDTIIINGQEVYDDYKTVDTITIIPGCDSIVIVDVVAIKMTYEFIQSYNIKENHSFQFFGNFENVESYSWTPDIDISCTDCESPIFTPSKSHDYELSMTTPEGCIIKDSISIRLIKDFDYYLPNTFSPNGDGINEIFSLFAEDEVIYNLYVFDRWGSNIYRGEALSSKDEFQGWDGTTDGHSILTAIYAYYISIESIAGDVLEEPIVKTGAISLIK